MKSLQSVMKTLWNSRRGNFLQRIPRCCFHPRFINSAVYGCSWNVCANERERKDAEFSQFICRWVRKVRNNKETQHLGPLSGNSANFSNMHVCMCSEEIFKSHGSVCYFQVCVRVGMSAAIHHKISGWTDFLGKSLRKGEKLCLLRNVFSWIMRCAIADKNH